MKKIISLLLTAVLAATGAVSLGINASAENACTDEGGHYYCTTVTKPTAEERGYTTHTCVHCGDSYKDTYTDKIEITDSSKVFKDVKKSHWFKEYVDYAYTMGLVSGKAEGAFAPSDNMTRAEFVTVLWRLVGSPVVKRGKSFADVPNGKWFTEQVAWSTAYEIINGTDDKHFSPNGKITREQLAAVLYRFADKMGYDISAKGDITTFPDYSKVSGYAREAFAWANGTGLVGGTTSREGVILDPKGNATRAQVAKILALFRQGCEAYSDITIGEYTDVIRAEINAKAEALKEECLAPQPVPQPTGNGRTYYVSNDGNDESDGLSEKTAWATLSRVSEEKPGNGSVVLFRRGDVFRGQLYLRYGVTYAAYGEGAMPKLRRCLYNGATDGKWETTEWENVYKYSIPIEGDVGNIILNDGEDYAGKEVADFEGSERNITLAGAIETKLTRDKRFFHDDTHYTGKDGDPCYVYLRSDSGNPADRWESIEFAEGGNMADGSASYVTVEGLCFEYGGAHGIGVGSARNFTVSHCEFRWIGGSIQYYRDSGEPVRFGNGVENWADCNTFTVEYCWVHDIYDTGITHQYRGENGATMQNILYRNNLIERCVMDIELFNDASTDNKGIMSNVTFKDNILLDAGGWGYTERPDKKAWCICEGTRDRTQNFTVKGNIFSGTEDTLIRITPESNKPIMAGNTYACKAGRIFGGVAHDSAKNPFDGTVTELITGFAGDRTAKIYFDFTE